MLKTKDFIAYSGLCEEDATSALKRAEGFVFSILWDIESKEKAETYNGNGEMTLVLKRFPVTAVSYMKFSGDTVDPADYFIQAEEWMIAMQSYFPRGYNVIEVQYTAWWTDATMPTQLKYAIYDLAVKIARAGDSYGSNVKSESIDGASISWWDIEKSQEESIINSYKRVTF